MGREHRGANKCKEIGDEIFTGVSLFTGFSGRLPEPTRLTDNGNPGQIKAVIFYDDNRNGVMDNGETGAQTEVGVSQDVSCPPSRAEAITSATADENGVALFMDLTPGKYCVHPIRNFGMTTRQNLEVYVSSDVITAVVFGIEKE